MEDKYQKTFDSFCIAFHELESQPNGWSLLNLKSLKRKLNYLIKEATKAENETTH